MIDLAEVAPAFSFVVVNGLVQSASTYTPDRFGNATIVMVGAPFSMRFTRDRGEVFVDAGSNSAGWHKLEDILQFVDHSVTQEQLGGPPNIAVMAKLLELNWNKVRSVFSDQQNIAQLREFGKQRSTAWIANIFSQRKQQ